MQISNHRSFRRRRGAGFRAAIVCSTAVALFAFASAPADADELSELKAQVEALMKRIEQLETKQAKLEKAPPAPARTVTSGKDDVQLSVSGQVNRGSFVADDGTESNTFHSDNENSSTRFRLVGTARHGPARRGLHRRHVDRAGHRSDEQQRLRQY